LIPDIEISLSGQTLLLNQQGGVKSYPVSTALNGAGEQKGSNCTPRGRHRIRAKIGGDRPIRSVFVGRRPTEEIYTDDLAAQYPERDWVLTRILWLCGEERGINRLGNVDTMQRLVYIHGCPDSEPMGVPKSHGCIRMTNADVAELYNYVDVGASVQINE
jgi:lipoprotein-anchoring transpeptidase ErfK/SrfK